MPDRTPVDPTWYRPNTPLVETPDLQAERGGVEYRPHLREKISRKSPRGKLAQAMFDSWMRRNGVQAADGKPVKFPKRVNGRPSLWWEMAGVALTDLRGKPGPLVGYVHGLLTEAGLVDRGGYVQVFREIDGRQEPDGAASALDVARGIADRIHAAPTPGRDGLQEVLANYLHTLPGAPLPVADHTGWAREHAEAMVSLLAIRLEALGLVITKGHRLPAPAILALQVYEREAEAHAERGGTPWLEWRQLTSRERESRTRTALVYLDVLEHATGQEDL